MRILANIFCWLLILPLMVVSVLASIVIGRLILGPPVMSANGLIDPVIFILSYLSPVAALGVIGLVFLRRTGLVKASSVILATALFLSFTAALVIYGLWFFHRMPEPFRLWQQVWWLQPIGILWLSAYAMCLATLRAGFIRKHHRLILFIFCTCVLMVLGAVLAWLFVTYDFEFSPVNLFAVIPFAVACASLIRVVFIWKDDHVA